MQARVLPVLTGVRSRRYAVYLLLITLMAAVAAPVPASPAVAATPPDVVGTPYAAAVAALLDLGVLIGYPDGTFRPTRTITRAEMAAVVVRATGHGPEAQTWQGYTTGFRDVPTGHWAAGYIAVAAKYGMLRGDPDGRFRPEDSVKYEEVLAIMVRAAGYGPQADAAGQWPLGYVSIGQRLGLLDQVAFQLGQAAPRGHVALIGWHAVFGAVNPATGQTLAQSVFNRTGDHGQLTISGVAEGGRYGGPVTPVITATGGLAIVTVNGAPWASGQPVTAWGDYTLVADLRDPTGFRTTAIVHFTLQPAGPPASIVLSGPATLPGDGATTATITAEVRDRDGIRVAAPVDITFATQGDLQFVTAYGRMATTVVTAQSGTASVTVATPAGRSVSGNAAVTASATGLPTAQYRISLVPPPPAKLLLTVVPGILDAIGSELSQATVTATLVDTAGRPVPAPKAFTVTFSVPDLRGPALFSGRSLTASQNFPAGARSVSVPIYATGTTGSTIVTASVSGEAANMRLAVVNATVAAQVGTDATRLTLSGVPDQIMAGDGLPVTVMVTDPFGVPKTAYGQLPLTISVVDNDGKTVAAASTTSSHGIAQVTLNVTRAGTFRLRAEGGDLIPAEQDVAVAAASPSKLGLAVKPVAIPADNNAKATLTATVLDRYGNPVPVDDIDVTFARTQTTAPVTKLPADTTVPTKDGVAALEVRATDKTGTDTFTATAPGLSASPGVALKAVTPMDIAGISVRTDYYGSVGKVQVGQTITVYAQVVDPSGRVVNYDEDREITLRPTGLDTLKVQTAKTVDGVATFTLTSTKAGRFELTADAVGLAFIPPRGGMAWGEFQPGDPTQVTITADPPSLQTSTPATPSMSQVSVQVSDRYGNAVDTNRYDLQWDTVDLEVVSTKGASFDQGTMLLTAGTAAERVTIRDHDGKANVYDRTRRTTITLPVRQLGVDVYAAGDPARLVITAGADKPISDGTDPTLQGVMVTVTVQDASGRRLTALDGFQVDLVAESPYLTVFDSAGTAGGASAASFTSAGIATFYVTSDHTGSYYVHAEATVPAGSGTTVVKSGRARVGFTAGAPAYIILTATKPQIRADGTSTVSIKGQVVDFRGQAVSYNGTMNFSVVPGGNAAYLTAASASVSNGVAYATLRAKTYPGPVEVKAWISALQIDTTYNGNIYNANVMVTDAASVALQDGSGTGGQVTVTAAQLGAGVPLTALVRKAGGGNAVDGTMLQFAITSKTVAAASLSPTSAESAGGTASTTLTAASATAGQYIYVRVTVVGTTLNDTLKVVVGQ